ncbi:hypothetical protein HK099_003046, partial [Clydaea vesicula]
MGCGASKVNNTVSPETSPAATNITTSKTNSNEMVELANKFEDTTNSITLMDRPVIPSIPNSAAQLKVSSTPAGPIASQKPKPVAFEIPIDVEFFEPVKEETLNKNNTDKNNSKEVVSNIIKVSLPKLNITPVELQSKLANTEEKWKDMEKKLAYKKDLKKKTHHEKPVLTRKSKKLGSTELKEKLLLKEAQATKNRIKEMEKLQAKLQKQEEHAKQVLERKKALGRSSEDNFSHISFGGEEIKNSSELIFNLTNSLNENRTISIKSLKAKNKVGMINSTGNGETRKRSAATDSGVSSAFSLSFGSSRSGSATSNQFDFSEDNHIEEIMT